MRVWHGDRLTHKVFALTAGTRAWSPVRRLGAGLLIVGVAASIRFATRDLLILAPHLPVLVALVVGAITFGRVAALAITSGWVVTFVGDLVWLEGGPPPSGGQVMILVLWLGVTVAISWLIASLAWALDNLERSDAELQASRDRLVGILDALPIGVSLRETVPGAAPVVNAAVGRILRGAKPQLDGPSGLGAWESYDREGRRTPGEAYPMARVFATGEPAQGEFHFRRGDGTLAWIRLVSAPLRDRSGRMIAGVTALVDIDRKMRLIEHQQWLVAELAHRTRNLMAVVQGLAMATIARAPSLDAFRDTFMGRLQALANAHSLFLKAAEEGVEVQSLVQEVLVSVVR